MDTHRLLVAHTHYTQPGGEDAVFKAEKALPSWMGDERLSLPGTMPGLNGTNGLSERKRL